MAHQKIRPLGIGLEDRVHTAFRDLFDGGIRILSLCRERHLQAVKWTLLRQTVQQILINEPGIALDEIEWSLRATLAKKDGQRGGRCSLLAAFHYFGQLPKSGSFEKTTQGRAHPKH